MVVETYGYIDNSNRTSWTDFWGTGTATYDDQDRLSTYGPTSYTYSANGELLTRTAGPDTTTYGYDVLGNLRTVTLPTGVEIEYLIDAANRRIGKKVDGTLVSGFLWQSQLQPAAELDGSGNVVAEFVYATRANVPDYLVKNGTTYRIFADHLGSVRLVVDAQSGQIAQRLDYDAFGRITFDSNPGFQPFGFAGGLYDSQTGLVRFGARDYDPETGRWTAKDPVGFGGGSALLYEYVSNDPVNRVDPSGLYEELVHYNRTYVWALQEGLSPFQADMIASANQGMDDDFWTTSPWWPWSGYRHFRERGAVMSDIFEAIERDDLADVGRHLHELQDTFSHAGYSYLTGGHAIRPEHFENWGLEYSPRAHWTDKYNPCSPRDRSVKDPEKVPR